MVPGAVHEADDIFADRAVDIHLADRGLHLAQLLVGAHHGQLVERMAALLLIEDHDLLDRQRVAQAQSEHEPVELGLGQGERALVLDRVLGGDHQERVGHGVGRAVDRRLALLHALEQTRLRLGRRPVDLVGEDDLGHDRPRPELELLGLLVVDRQAGHVRRQQVRGELDPAKGAVETAGKGLGQDRLARARHVLDQQVAAAHQRDEGETHLVVLAHDHPLDIRDDLLAGLLDLRHRPPSVTGTDRADRLGLDRRIRRGRVGRSYARDGCPVPIALTRPGFST